MKKQWFLERYPKIADEEIRDPVVIVGLGRPEDISAAATFLCSEDASFITGAILDVDGGLIMGKSPLGLSQMAGA